MAHVELPDLPGIISLFARFPESGKQLSSLTETLLRGPSPLSASDRETIAAYVSDLNRCRFCARSHMAAARHLVGEDQADAVERVCTDPESAPVSPKLKALLNIAAKVAESGLSVASADIRRARDAGATDREIHDTVLVSAAFCMFNRYVDGLATWAPDDEAVYDGIGARLAHDGYGGASSA